MAPSIDRPNLSTGNLIYLYELLKREIGCGKQTFMPVVEQALETDRMTAADLGFANTQALLEALEAFVKLTVFKGGRVYATVIAQPDWDETLACAPTAKSAAKNDAKPWKRKKANKALKPARPKRVKRVEAAAEVAAETDEKVEAKAGTQDAEPQAPMGDAGDSIAEAPADSAVASDPVVASQPAAATGPSAPKLRNEDVFESASPAEEPPVQEPETPVCADEDTTPAPTREPAITLTVTYDPYSGIDEETKLESNPHIADAKPTVPPTTGAGEPRTQTAARAAAGAKRADLQPNADGQASASSATPHADATPAHAPSTSTANGPATAAATSTSATMAPEPAPTTAPAAANQAVAHEPASAATPAAMPDSAPTATPSPTPASAPGTASAKAPTAASQSAAAPATAPQSAVAPNTALENDPAIPSASAYAAPRPEILATYPQDVATEVYLAHERIGELCELLPYGTDVFALLAEDWKRALALELVRGTRARITFPLRIAHADDASPIEVTLKKRSGGALKWELAGVC